MFEVVDDWMPRHWARQRGEDGALHAYPKELARPAFFEDYFDDDIKFIHTLRVVLNREGGAKPKRASRSP